MLTTTAPPSWTTRGAAFVLWLLAAASAVYWGLRVSGTGSAAGPAPVAATPVLSADPAAVARLLGGGAPGAMASAPAAPTFASRFQLLGVAAGARSGEGAAVIAMDGKPARSYRVGALLEEGLVLMSVQGRKAVLGTDAQGPAVLTLELPPQRR